MSHRVFAAIWSVALLTPYALSQNAVQPSTPVSNNQQVVTAGTPQPEQPSAAPASAPASNISMAAKPRIFLQSQSHGNTAKASRDQSMEMGKDFEEVCPGVRITINQQMADYTVLLNHVEIGAFSRDNQVQIADKNGDLISRTKEGGSIKGAVKKACDLILADFAKSQHN
jgi:hypothetical protein